MALGKPQCDTGTKEHSYAHLAAGCTHMHGHTHALEDPQEHTSAPRHTQLRAPTQEYTHS
jgi:hypothetical protein